MVFISDNHCSKGPISIMVTPGCSATFSGSSAGGCWTGFMAPGTTDSWSVCPVKCYKQMIYDLLMFLVNYKPNNNTSSIPNL